MNSGYRETISEAREKWLQTGFNQGFKESVGFGFVFGKVSGVISSSAHLLEMTPTLFSQSPLRKCIFQLNEKINQLSKERTKINNLQVKLIFLKGFCLMVVF